MEEEEDKFCEMKQTIRNVIEEEENEKQPSEEKKAFRVVTIPGVRIPTQCYNCSVPLERQVFVC